MSKINDLCHKIRTRIYRSRVEDRVFNYYKNRWDAIDNLADYLVGADIQGDYLEFGVAIGMTFTYACKIMSPVFKEMKFFALDSFEGLPKPQGIDAAYGYTSTFFEGQFACSEENFKINLKKSGVNLQKVSIVKGWFNQSLNNANAKKFNIDKIAAAWVDCDLYESTVPVLDFLTSRISVGTVILFDDWRCFRNLPDFGQQRACSEWLETNPQIKLYELFSFGWHGVAFTVGSC